MTYRVRLLDGEEVDVGVFDGETEAFAVADRHQAESERITWVTTHAGDKAEADWSPVAVTRSLKWIYYGESMKWLVDGRLYVGHVSWFQNGDVLARYNPGFQNTDLVMHFEGGTQEQRIASAAAWLADKAKNS